MTAVQLKLATDSEFYEKQLEMILGMKKEPALQLLKQKGISIQSVSDFLHAARYDLVSRPRFTMEHTDDEVHFIPYCKVMRRGTGEYLVYQRPFKGEGESRLGGKFSIGFAGHVDLMDFVSSSKSVCNAYATNLDSVMRELFEELKYSLPAWPGQYLDASAIPDKIELQVHGFIYDDSDDVGQNHLGVYMTLVVADDVIVESNEPSILDPHWASLEDINYDVKLGHYDFENWSTMLLQHETEQLGQ